MGFFKELLAAAKEGVAEAKDEAGQEKAAAAEEARVRTAALEAELAATPSEVVFAVALGAVYRNIFLLELERAPEQGRRPVHLYLPRVPEAEVDSMRRLLNRDFEVVDAVSAESTLAVLAARLADADDVDEEAVWITRACYVAAAAAGLGLLPLGRAFQLTAPFADRARVSFHGWNDFGDHFLAGERRTPASNPLGRRALRREVTSLVQTPGSPWREWAWPPPPVETDRAV